MTNNLFTPGKFYQYYMPVALTLFMFVTIERQVEIPDGGYDRLYGLPLPWKSNSFSFSFHFHVHLLYMFLNIAFYFGVAILLFAGLRKLGLNLQTHWIAAIVSTLLLMFYVFVTYVYLEESSFYFLPRFEYETTGRKLILLF